MASRLAASLPAGAPEAARSEIAQAWIGADFDLTTALTQNVAFTNSNHSLDRWLGLRLPSDDQDAENRENDRFTSAPPDYNPHEPSSGIPPRTDGTLPFAKLLAAYGPGLTPAEKFLFLLTEVERLDTSPHRDAAAEALLRRAMAAQLFYGPQIAQSWVEWWQSDRVPHFGATPYGAAKAPAPPVPATKVWELHDDQAIVPVGGWLRVVDLPADESPLALLAAIETRCPQSTLLPEVRYARAFYHQSRQQYPLALAEYRALIEQFPTNPRAKDARAQMQGIEAPSLSLGDTEMYFPGERPKLAFTARNAGTVEFTATRFDLIRYAEETDTLADIGGINRPSIFDSKSPWRKYLAKEPVHWSETLPPGQENRPVENSTLAPLTTPGAYVVEARVAGNKNLARVLVVVTDILLLGKNVRDGDQDAHLIVACDARTGRPQPDRALRVYEHWQEPDHGTRKGRTHVDRRTLITNADGAVTFRRGHPEPSSGIEAAMVGQDGQIAFSGLRRTRGDYSGGGDAKETRQGYAITDRPVYRPGAMVHYCIWLRTKRDGVFQVPKPGPIKVQVSDVYHRHTKVSTAQIDETGAISGE